MIRAPAFTAPAGISRTIAKVASGRVKCVNSTDLSGLLDSEGTTHLLRHYRVDLDRVAHKLPCVLRYDVAKTQAAIEILERHNIDIGKAVNRNPRLLSMAPDVLDARLHLLTELLGERMVQRAISSSVSLLSSNPDTLHRNIAMLTSLGLDAKMMVKRYPLVVTRTETVIHSRMYFFEFMGLDAVRIINAKPEVVHLSIERTLRPIVEYITKDMGRSLEEINECPRCFSTSLMLRLKPRHEYLILYAKTHDYSLNSICARTDLRFASLTTRSPGHYRQWFASQTSD